MLLQMYCVVISQSFDNTILYILLLWIMWGFYSYYYCQIEESKDEGDWLSKISQWSGIHDFWVEKLWPHLRDVLQESWWKCPFVAKVVFGHVQKPLFIVKTDIFIITNQTAGESNGLGWNWMGSIYRHKVKKKLRSCFIFKTSLQLNIF